MDKNKEDSPDKYVSFNISDLPTYGYLYKEEDEKGFNDDFSFSISKEPKFGGALLADGLSPFLGKYPAKPELHEPQSHPKGPIDLFKGLPETANTLGYQPPMGLPKEYPPYKKAPPKDPMEKYKAFGYSPYGQSEEQAIFVNANQYPYIKRRKERRDYLDSLEKKKDVGYQHESRHNHAMKRPRAPSGRFLTKEEAMQQDPEADKQ
ncbi:hypothetical protein NEHOM01_1990 [Nematocida homosporus]|uniref:uncharacterized protein n=1 Tax=Nematocida homosporus TaxID=1912981 RepID=UPI002220A237|nr:uncharacterized protein NEHOM01_1990 [Nematocida homosporus]KAI5187181.1 hypothetical protein NEHOM01_1990 [Nematocida homosporus]